MCYWMQDHIRNSAKLIVTPVTQPGTIWVFRLWTKKDDNYNMGLYSLSARRLVAKSREVPKPRERML